MGNDLAKKIAALETQAALEPNPQIRKHLLREARALTRQAQPAPASTPANVVGPSAGIIAKARALGARLTKRHPAQPLRKRRKIASNYTAEDRADGSVVYYSYEEPVAADLADGSRIRRAKKFSATTSAHVNRFAKDYRPVDEAEWAKLVGGKEAEPTGKFNPALKEDQQVKDGMGQTFTARFVGKDPLTGANLFEGGGDVRGPIGEKHSADALVASEYGMTGPDVYFSWLTLNNDSATYERALAYAKKKWQAGKMRKPTMFKRSTQRPGRLVRRAAPARPVVRKADDEDEEEDAWDGETLYIVIDGTEYEADNDASLVAEGVASITLDGKSWYLAESSDAAAEYVKERYREMDSDEIVEVVGAEKIVIEWTAGRSFEDWLDEYMRMDGPAGELASADGNEGSVAPRAVIEKYGREAWDALVEAVGFEPDVAYQS